MGCSSCKDKAKKKREERSPPVNERSKQSLTAQLRFRGRELKRLQDEDTAIQKRIDQLVRRQNKLKAEQEKCKDGINKLTNLKTKAETKSPFKNP